MVVGLLETIKKLRNLIHLTYRERTISKYMVPSWVELIEILETHLFSLTLSPTTTSQ